MRARCARPLPRGPVGATCGPASTQETEAEAWVRRLSYAEHRSASEALRHVLAEI